MMNSTCSKNSTSKGINKENKDAIIREIMERVNVAHPKHINYRLMQEWEVPEWVKYQPQTNRDDELTLGKRQRK